MEKNRRRIAIIPSRYPSIYQPNNYIFVKEQAELLAAHHDVIVVGCIPISMKFFFSKEIKFYSSNKSQQNHLHSFFIYFPAIPKFSWLNEILRSMINKILIRKLLKREHIDIFHFHSIWAAAIGEWLYNTWGKKYIITEHSSLFLYPLNSLNKQIAEKAFRFSEFIVAVSQSLANNIQSKFGTRCTVISNMVDTQFFSPQFMDNRGKPRKILTIGNLVDVKNHFGLLNAFFVFSREVQDVNLDIIGEGPNRNKLLRHIEKLGLADKVKLLGFKKRVEIRDYLNSADFFVMSSVHETFGIVVIEALAMGTPVLCTEFGGVSNELHGKPGCLIVKSDQESLIDGLKRLMSFQKSTDIREYVVKKYSHLSVAKRLNDIYDKVLSKSEF